VRQRRKRRTSRLKRAAVTHARSLLRACCAGHAASKLPLWHMVRRLRRGPLSSLPLDACLCVSAPTPCVIAPTLRATTLRATQRVSKAAGTEKRFRNLCIRPPPPRTLSLKKSLCGFIRPSRPTRGTAFVDSSVSRHLSTVKRSTSPLRHTRGPRVRLLVLLVPEWCEVQGWPPSLAASGPAAVAAVIEAASTQIHPIVGVGGRAAAAAVSVVPLAIVSVGSLATPFSLAVSVQVP
jgi:hypothetical protein